MVVVLVGWQSLSAADAPAVGRTLQGYSWLFEKMVLLAKRLLLPTGWLYYLEGGDVKKARSPVVFLHGWALSSALFHDGLARLATERRVIGLDWPGFNRSRVSVANWHYEDYAQVISAFVENLHLSPYHLVGHSTGGAIAIAVAAQYAEQVRSLTLIDSAGIPLESFWRVAGRKALEIPAQFMAMPYLRRHLQLLLTVLYNFIFRAVNTYHCMQLPLYTNLSAYLSRIRAPSLVVWGEHDGMVPIALGRQLAKNICGATWLALPNAYHEWSLLQPKLFACVVEDFISQH